MSRPAARRRLLRASLAVLAVLVVRRAYQHLALLCRHLHLSTWLLRALGSSAPPLSPLADECELSSELSDEIRSLGAANTQLSPAALAEFDVVIITTNHKDVDYDLVVEHAPLILDTRNALEQEAEHIVKL